MLEWETAYAVSQEPKHCLLIEDEDVTQTIGINVTDQVRLHKKYKTKQEGIIVEDYAKPKHQRKCHDGDYCNIGTMISKGKFNRALIKIPEKK